MQSQTMDLVGETPDMIIAFDVSTAFIRDRDRLLKGDDDEANATMDAKKFES